LVLERRGRLNDLSRLIFTAPSARGAGTRSSSPPAAGVPDARGGGEVLVEEACDLKAARLNGLTGPACRPEPKAPFHASTPLAAPSFQPGTPDSGIT